MNDNTKLTSFVREFEFAFIGFCIVLFYGLPAANMTGRMIADCQLNSVGFCISIIGFFLMGCGFAMMLAHRRARRTVITPVKH